MIDSTLVSEAQRLLNCARLIAEAPAAQTTQIGHQHPDSRMPPGLAFSRSGSLGASSVSTLEAFGVRINTAILHDSEPELRAANKWCRAELDSLQHGTVVVPETEAEFSARINRDYEGVIAPVVARAERTYVRKVRDARAKGGRDARRGHKLHGREPGSECRG